MLDLHRGELAGGGAVLPAFRRGLVMAIFLDLAGGEPGSETGERPVMVEVNAHCDECGQQHDIEKCPKCGSFIELGFGLMFGGFGEYKFCGSGTCDWFWKREADE